MFLEVNEKVDNTFHIYLLSLTKLMSCGKNNVKAICNLEYEKA